MTNSVNPLLDNMPSPHNDKTASTDNPTPNNTTTSVEDGGSIDDDELSVEEGTGAGVDLLLREVRQARPVIDAWHVIVASEFVMIIMMKQGLVYHVEGTMSVGMNEDGSISFTQRLDLSDSGGHQSGMGTAGQKGKLASNIMNLLINMSTRPYRRNGTQPHRHLLSQRDSGAGAVNVEQASLVR